MTTPFAQLNGWKEDAVGIKAAAKEHGALGQVASNLIGGEEKTVMLWQPLLKVDPTWRRGSQGIGDCVSWGSSGDTTVLMAVQSVLGEMDYEGQAASEADYGGCRVEALNKQSGGYQDGAFGYAVAKWVKDYGVVLRKDHSGVTGNPEHDLRRYNKDKAKAWGNFGCGGQKDANKLDNLAKIHPVAAIAEVNTIPEAIGALTNGYPFCIASMAGFGQMKRDADGVCRWVDSWAHQMFVWGLRWRKGKPQFRICQSWGDSCSGPDPDIPESLEGIWTPPKNLYGAVGSKIQAELPWAGFPCVADMTSGTWNPVSACSWWCVEEDMAKILKSGDCWVYSGVQGFKKRKIDFNKAFATW